MFVKFVFPSAFLHLFLLIPSLATGAPFCIERQGLPAECWYYDVRSCRQQAEKRDSYCSVNTEEVTLSEHGAPYCIIDSSMQPICAYQRGENCDVEARRRNAVCFENLQEDVQDPYRLDRPPFRYR